MVRQIINPNQTTDRHSYFYNGKAISFDKIKGRSFSDDKKDDLIVNFFIRCKGFKLVKEEKKIQPTQSINKDKKKQFNSFKKNKEE